MSKKMAKCKTCEHQVSKLAKMCPNCGEKNPSGRTSAFTWFVAVFLFVGGIGAILDDSSFDGSGFEGSSSNNVKYTANYINKEVAIISTSLDFKWSKTGFDNIMEADFTIKNNNNFDIKDIKIECVYSAKSGTKIDNNKETIYEIVKAHKTKKFTGISMGFIHSQVNSSSCHIYDLTII